MREFVIDDGAAGQRFEKYIKRILPAASTGFVFKMLRKKNITLNGHKADGREILQPQDRVNFYLSEETFAKFAGRPQTAGSSRTPGAASSSVRAGRQMQPAQERADLAAYRRNVQADFAAASYKKDARADLAAYEKAYRCIEQQYGRIPVVFEDADILVVDKPVGLLSQKAAAQDMSLNEWFVGFLLSSGRVQADSLGYYTPSIANRLDRNTGGLVLCAKTLRGSRSVSAMLRDRTLHKYYQAVVAGRLEHGGTMEGYLSKDRENNRVVVCSVAGNGSVTNNASAAVEAGTINAASAAGEAGRINAISAASADHGQHPVMKHVVTRCRPLGYSADGTLTLVEAELVTGKTHQLRAQFASIGHPIVGDGKYGSAAVNARYRRYGVHSQLLYCVKIVFPDGRSIETKPPALFGKIMKEQER